MISKFRIQNFRSIVDLTLDFRYGEGKAPNGYENLDSLPFLTAPNKERLVPCMAFFGANASGKSNIMKALVAFYNLQNDKPLKEIFDPNITNPQKNGIFFELGFIFENNVFSYAIAYTGDAIQKETLSVDGNNIFTIENMRENFSGIQLEAYPPSKLSEILRVEASDGGGNQIRPMLACFGTRYKGLNTKITKAHEFCTRKMLFVQNTKDFSLETAVHALAQTTGGDKAKALAEIVEIIRRLDIDIENITMKSWKMADNDQNKAQIKRMFPDLPENFTLNGVMTVTHSFHKTVTGEIIECNFEKMESAGTIRMAGLAGILLYAIKTGQAVFVDELDNSLHPFIVIELLKLFKKKRYNTRNAQLFFTTHATDVLEDGHLRVSEITFVRKNIKSGTMAKRLVDLKRENEEDDSVCDIRNTTNFRKQYLQDYYSGIPYPAL